MLQCGTTTNEQLKIELLSRWKLEAEFRNCLKVIIPYIPENMVSSSALTPFCSSSLWRASIALHHDFHLVSNGLVEPTKALELCSNNAAEAPKRVHSG